ncbi:hypothetical protein CLAIMM_09532 [Cladophialophora immunda]|nr:hypothetical protein CLAIMM_09532 [Cladophialophora immunda]
MKRFVIGNIYVIASIAVVGGGLFGFDIASMSGILGTAGYKCYFNQGPEGPPFNDNENCSGPRSLVQGGITASMAAGSWVGALISGFMSDWLGRKMSIILGCLFWIAGSTVCAASQNIGMLIGGRILNGISVGIESAQVPVYVSELAPPSKRGRLVGLQQMAISCGIMIMYYISYGGAHIGGQTSSTFNPLSFRVPWAIQMVPAIYLMIGMTFLPESPRWLAKKDRWEECKSVLTLVHGKGNPHHQLVVLELAEISATCELERQFGDVTYWELFQPKMLNRTIIGAFDQIWCQLSGMNLMMYYVTFVFGMAGYKGNSNLLASSIQYVINVVMTIPALIWVDRWGRRPTLMAGSLGCAIWMFASGGVLGTYGTHVPGGVNGVAEQSMLISGAPAKALIAFTYLFVGTFATTWSPVSWIYPPELFPLRVRGKAVALSTSANWAFNTALGLFVPVAFVNIQWKTYLIFGTFLVASFVHVFFFFPETSGKTLEEVEGIFDDPHGIRYLGTPAWKTHKETQRASALEHNKMDASEVEAWKADNKALESATVLHQEIA